MPAQNTILVVDDVPNNLDMITRLLESNGYVVRPTLNPFHALEAVQQAPPSLIIADIMMPEMSGFDLCKVFQSDIQLKHIPVILISALDGIEEIKQGFDSGAVDYITKPFQKEEVLARVKTHLELGYLRGQARQKAILEERQRIARELHDAVSQTLFSANIIAESLPYLIDNKPEDAKESSSDLAQLTKGALAEMRTLLVELRTNSLEDTDFMILLTNLIDGLRARVDGAVQFQVECNDDVKVPRSVKTDLYRITQEAMNNIIKHAQANNIDITLECESLTIIDDGIGFDLHSRSSDHFGMRIMQERATDAKLNLEIESELEHGTRIYMSWRDIDAEEN